MLLKGASLEEQNTVVSGPCIAGRKTAGSGGMEELTGADVVDQLPAATPSAAGKMTAAYSSKLDGIADGADATGFRGNVTTSQRDALTGLSAGHWVRNTDWPFGQNIETWSGSIWVRQGCAVLTNRTGAVLPYGYLVAVSTSYDSSVVLTSTSGSIKIFGVNTTGGVADGNDVAIAPIGTGLIVDVHVAAYLSVSRDEFIFQSTSSGHARGNNAASAGAFGRWLVNYQAQAGGGLARGILTSNAEIY